ncbi:glycosyltransferase family 4 protein [Parvularcula marina]|uniref:Glycosyltransferase n=1 Tax=Parvularcula marina TaxID=2292771 RepID=A0A371RGC8_9PROT|nr:glycosyltransferase family 4 protein [Parvularcula marina]RFB04500.1 glycosyltransferase [Parvularcula marina]
MSLPPEVLDARVIVVQMGARHRYAVPSIFEKAGLLEAFYTDLCGTSGSGKAAGTLSKLPLPGGIRKKLSNFAGRLPPELIREKTKSFDRPALAYEMRMARATSPAVSAKARQDFDRDWGEAMIAAGYGDATHIYTMMSGQTLEGGRFLEEARHRGLEVAADMTIAPSVERIMEEECRLFPGWDGPVTYCSVYNEDNPHFTRMKEVVTRFVCPSDFVADDIIENWGIDKDRVRIEPYAVNDLFFGIENEPEPGTILFAGSADLRKGIQYLAMAAEILRARGRDYRFRIVGNTTAHIVEQPLCKPLDFVGRVPRERMLAEYKKADLFVLPSVAEGSAGVAYEAMAAGLPSVVTKAVGSPARDGIETSIVPERDPEALANAIEALVEDRAARDRMGTAAKDFARQFAWDLYEDRLIRAVLG